MKQGYVYKSERVIYLVVADYGTLRPLIIDKSDHSKYEMNCVKEFGIAKHDVTPTTDGFYQGDVLIAKSLEEYVRNEWV